jgi:hypothetical protein
MPWRPRRCAVTLGVRRAVRRLQRAEPSLLNRPKSWLNRLRRLAVLSSSSSRAPLAQRGAHAQAQNSPIVLVILMHFLYSTLTNYILDRPTGHAHRRPNQRRHLRRAAGDGRRSAQTSSKFSDSQTASLRPHTFSCMTNRGWRQSIGAFGGCRGRSPRQSAPVRVCVGM